MNEWRYFVWLCGQAAEWVTFPPLLVPLVVLAIIIAGLCVGLRPIKTRLWKPWYWLVFTQLLFYPAVLALAALRANPVPPTHDPNKVASVCADILSWMSLAFAAFWVWRMKGLRWLAFSLVMLQQLLLLGAFLIADMAISGRWL